jgi:hypothetical protein
VFIVHGLLLLGLRPQFNGFVVQQKNGLGNRGGLEGCWLSVEMKNNWDKIIFRMYFYVNNENGNSIV